MNFLRQGFRKLSSDRHRDRQTRRDIYTTPLSGWSNDRQWPTVSVACRQPWHTVRHCPAVGVRRQKKRQNDDGLSWKPADMNFPGNRPTAPTVFSLRETHACLEGGKFPGKSIAMVRTRNFRKVYIRLRRFREIATTVIERTGTDFQRWTAVVMNAYVRFSICW